MSEGRGDRREKIVRVKEILELWDAGIKDNLTPQINRFHISPRWNEGKSRFHPSTIYRTYGVNWTSMAGRAHPSTIFRTYGENREGREGTEQRDGWMDRMIPAGLDGKGRRSEYHKLDLEDCA